MTDRPRIVANALPLDERGGGVSTYVRELLGGLHRRDDVDVVAAVRPAGLLELPVDMATILRSESTGVRRAFDGLRGFGPADLVHGLDVDLPIGGRAVRVSTVHDLAVFDVPETFPRRRAVGERFLVRSSLRRADAIIAVSAFTAERVRAWTGRDAVVIPEAPSPEMIPASAEEIAQVVERYRLPDRFVLHVGNVEPRKDLETLAAACRIAQIPLVLTGHSLWSNRAPEGTASIGHVPTVDLPALYGASTLVGYASRYEGFGLPPVEAMACGAAVISTPVPSIVESVPDVAATFTPGDVDGLARLLGEVVPDRERRRFMAEEGRRAASKLTWDEAAGQTIEVYRSLGVSV